MLCSYTCNALHGRESPISLTTFKICKENSIMVCWKDYSATYRTNLHKTVLYRYYKQQDGPLHSKQSLKIVNLCFYFWNKACIVKETAKDWQVLCPWKINQYTDDDHVIRCPHDKVTAGLHDIKLPLDFMVAIMDCRKFQTKVSCN
jgi:hypothetical protein